MKNTNRRPEVKKSLTVVTIAKNEANNIDNFLKRLSWVDEVIIINNNSTDRTKSIALDYTSKIFDNSDTNLGRLKNFAIEKASGDWIFVLDVDEYVSEELKNEIESVLIDKSQFDAYSISYQNHLLGHQLKSKAQQYEKVRLFRKGKGFVANDPVHEEMIIKGKTGKLNGKIYHYSFRSMPQIISKFTQYAKTEAPLLSNKGIKTHISHLIKYPLHMFWTIFVEDQGYKDGVYGFLLALCFAYYEFARYFFLFIYSIRRKIGI